jgi:predicted DNA-binding transcriptional regulator YafY
MRVDRLLSIMLMILNKGTITGKELAENYEVSIRTIYRDIEKLCEAGVPIASMGGIGGGFYIMESYNLDKLFFNKREVKPFMEMMNSLKLMFGKNQDFKDLALKFERLYDGEKYSNNNLTINMSHFSMEEELKEGIYIINKAIEDNNLLEFDYINRRMEYSVRIVEPIQIIYNDGEWYLLAFCRNRKDHRKFKLVRMRNIKLGNYFTKSDVTIEEIKSKLDKDYISKSIKVKLKFPRKAGEQLKEYFPRESITTTVDNFNIVEEFYPYEEGLIKFILSLGNDCEVIEPLYLRRAIEKYIKELLKKYND